MSRARLAAGSDLAGGSRILAERAYASTLLVVCAWCEAIITPGGRTPASHGMCPECFERLTQRPAA